MTQSRLALTLLAEALRPGAEGLWEAAGRACADDWYDFVALANAHYVGPALCSSLSQADRLCDLPNDVGEYLTLLHRANAQRNRRLRRQAEELIAAFNEAGIVPLLLKGSLALFLDHYPDDGARMISDLDILIPKDRLDQGLAALAASGYRMVTRAPDGHHAYGDFARDGLPGAVDLHLELIGASYLLPASEVWARARTVRVEQGCTFQVPSPGDRLLHNFLHAQIHDRGNHYRGVIELRQLYDFVMLARRCEQAVDWGALTGHLSRYRLDGAVQSYLLAAAGLFALPWPLPGPAKRAARWHYRRCRLQLRTPWVARAGKPFANLQGAFARHRMDALYNEEAALLRRRLRHARQFLDKTTARDTVGRFFKDK